MDAEKMLSKLEMHRDTLEALENECGEAGNFGDPQDMANIAETLLEISDGAVYVALNLFREINRKYDYTPVAKEPEAEGKTA